MWHFELYDSGLHGVDFEVTFQPVQDTYILSIVGVPSWSRLAISVDVETEDPIIIGIPKIVLEIVCCR